jgi:hypothetical protein
MLRGVWISCFGRSCAVLDTATGGPWGAHLDPPAAQIRLEAPAEPLSKTADRLYPSE